MSAASQARERARKASLIIDEDETPDPDDIAFKVVSWDFERKVAWWCRHSKEVADILEYERLVISDNGVFGIPKSRPAPKIMPTITRDFSKGVGV